MKRSGSSYEPLSPCLREYQPQHPVGIAAQHLAPSAQASDFAEIFQDALAPTQNGDPLQQYLGSYVEPYDAQANTSNQSNFAGTSVDVQGNFLQAQQSHQHSERLLRGIVNCAESPGLVGASRHARSAHHHLPTAAALSPYNTHRRSYSVTSQRSALTPMRNPPAASAESKEACPTPYSPYRGLFPDSDAARDHRHLSTRFGRRPYILPEDDPSIEQVERNRNHQVGRIYDAMICGDRVQDNAGSIAVKRWVHGAHYKSDLVEAFAHKVFDCLLVQVKEGFRGWHHNDYVDDDRKGEKEDHEADCASRLENIIDALEREKTVCEDVVNSASQIRMFVNAPVAYAQRKFQNRQGNSKRVRAKDTLDSANRPTKTRRTRGRQTRNRSTATPDRPVSRDTTPQFHMSAAPDLPYYTSPSQQLPPSPAPTFLVPRQPLQRAAMSMPRVPTGYTTTASSTMSHTDISPTPTTSRAAMSSPTLPAPNPYTTPMPPAQMLPGQTPSPQSYTYPPSSPETTTYPPEPWPTPTTSNAHASLTLDPSLTNDALSTHEDHWPSDTASTPYNLDPHLSGTHISLADIEHVSYPAASDSSHECMNAFDSFWNGIPGVQRFSFDGAVE